MTNSDKVNILVVDDTPSKLLAISVALSELDQNVVTAYSGREALRRLLAQEFAVILLDVNMPDIDGFETASLIRERPSSAHVPIIFMTAHSDDTFAARGYSLGAVDYLLTPVIPEILRAKVSVFVELFRKSKEVQSQADQRIALAQEQVARRTAEAANQLKDEFLATLSHELRTPLNSILGWVQLLKMNSATEEDLANGLEVIERNARIQARIIEDLLDVSRIVSGKLKLEPRSASVAEIAEAAIVAVQPNADAKKINLVRQFDPAAGLAMIDPTRMQQAIWNLLANAVKFTPAGGTIAVGVRNVAEELEISVTDSGEGIAPEFIPYVFERFRQADASTSRRHGGLGLGLSLVRQLIEMHGGYIDVESPGPGQGSIFRIRVPRARSDGGHARSTAAPVEARRVHDLRGVRVVVVDDQADACAWLARVFSDAGAQPRVALSANEAIEVIKDFQPQVLVSDIGMPERDGYDLIRQLRSDPANVDLLAVALTAYARPEDRAKALKAGFQLHVTKPVDGDELIKALCGLMKRHQDISVSC